MYSHRPEAGDAEAEQERRQAGWSRIRLGVLGGGPQAVGEAGRVGQRGRAGKSRAQTEHMIAGVDTRVAAQRRRGLDRRSLVQGDTPERAEDSSEWVPGRTSKSNAMEAELEPAEEARMRHFRARQVAEIVRRRSGGGMTRGVLLHTSWTLRACSSRSSWG